MPSGSEMGLNSQRIDLRMSEVCGQGIDLRMSVQVCGQRIDLRMSVQVCDPSNNEQGRLRVLFCKTVLPDTGT